MEIVGSDEQMACVGFALYPTAASASGFEVTQGAGKNERYESSAAFRNCNSRLISLLEQARSASDNADRDIDYSPFCPTNWSSLSSKSTLKVVSVP